MLENVSPAIEIKEKHLQNIY